MLGNSVVIPCEAEGYPEPEITWLKGGNEFNSQYMHRRVAEFFLTFFLCYCHFNLNSDNAEGKSSKEFKSIQLRNNSLTIDYVTDADEGYYMCNANNGIGSGLKKILHINVNGKYIRVTNLNACRIQSMINNRIENDFCSKSTFVAIPIELCHFHQFDLIDNIFFLSALEIVVVKNRFCRQFRLLIALNSNRTGAFWDCI